MKLAVHGACLGGRNLYEDWAIVRGAGFNGVEIWAPKLTTVDGGASELRGALGDLTVPMIDVLLPIEDPRPEVRQTTRDRCAQLATIAQELGAPAIQVVALDHFPDGSRPAIHVTRALGELAGIASAHGVRLGLEPVCFSSFHRLDEALEAIDSVGADRVGLVLDTFHMWASGWSLADIAAIPPSLIVCVQVGDSRPPSGRNFSDLDRDVMPGGGVIPLHEMIDAVRSTGYAGPWTAEVHGLILDELAAAELRRRTEDLLRH